MARKRISRRNFMGDVGAAVAFTIVPRHVLGRGFRAPSDTLNIACIGVGGRGREDVKGVASENIYALCDVDDVGAAETYAKYPRAKRYKDFRELLDREAKRIDAVVVATPDHTHAAAAIMAMKAGKHVYCEKPLARTIDEVRAIVDAARKSKVATQMGNQGHANEGTRQIREWVEAGAIGAVREVHCWTNRPIWPQGQDRPLEEYFTPATLTWDLWLGRITRRMRRSSGAAGGTSAAAPWATWPATSWTRRSGRSTSGGRSGSSRNRRSSTRRPRPRARASSTRSRRAAPARKSSSCGGTAASIPRAHPRSRTTCNGLPTIRDSCGSARMESSSPARTATTPVSSTRRSRRTSRRTRRRRSIRARPA